MTLTLGKLVEIAILSGMAKSKFPSVPRRNSRLQLLLKWLSPNPPMPLGELTMMLDSTAILHKW